MSSCGAPRVDDRVNSDAEGDAESGRSPTSGANRRPSEDVLMGTSSSSNRRASASASNLLPGPHEASAAGGHEQLQSAADVMYGQAGGNQVPHTGRGTVSSDTPTGPIGSAGGAVMMVADAGNSSAATTQVVNTQPAHQHRRHEMPDGGQRTSEDVAMLTDEEEE